jgi:hypothetical protein
MRTRIALLMVVLAAIAGLVLIAPITAQDEMMTHTCDSTTILLLYLAEHDYGFHSMMDVSTFEKGQYAPFFEAMMAMMEEGDMMEEEMMATEEAMMEEGDMMMEEEMMMLAPAVIADEDPACTELRAEVEAYLYATLSAEMMMMEEDGG